MAANKWSESDAKQFADYVSAGLSAVEVTRRMKRWSYTTIYNRYIKLKSLQCNKSGEKPVVIKKRKCLKCKCSFESTGSGNRMCSNCKSVNTGYNQTVYC